MRANVHRAEGEQGDARGVPDGIFDRHRPLLFSIAYRMLGSVMDAEDVVQEAYLRWQRASQAERYALGERTSRPSSPASA